MTTNRVEDTSNPSAFCMLGTATELYPTARKKGDPKPKDLLNVLAYPDGQTPLLDIAQLLDRPLRDLAKVAATLKNVGLLEERPQTGT